MAAVAKHERYELGAPLGRGGQGHTYRAKDRESGETVAVKVITLRGAESWKPFDLFERECQTLRTLSHPGIPRYLDTYAEEEEGRYYLVMELVEGRSLRDGLAEGELLSEPQLWNILHQALEILDYLHGRRPPVIHRDIKPANLIQRSDARLALVDFGGVRVALREEGGSTVVGTFGYMAPEQLHGEATPATDIYGLGATLATLATGIEADKLPRQGLKIDLGPVMAASRLREIIGRMLEPDPGQRLRSVTAVREALSAVVSTPPTRQPSPPSEDDDEADQDSPLADVGFPFSLVLRLVGTAGYVGLTLVDAVLLPLLFAMLGAAWSGAPRRQRLLKERKQSIRRVLRGGRRAMRSLSRGSNPYRLKSGPEPPRQLPPHRNGEGRGRGRHRGRRRR
jgi:serine/threonine protein kinase